MPTPAWPAVLLGILLAGVVLDTPDRRASMTALDWLLIALGLLLAVWPPPRRISWRCQRVRRCR